MSRRRRSVYLEDYQWDALAEMARAEDRSVNGIVRRFVAEGLARSSDSETYETLDEHNASVGDANPRWQGGLDHPVGTHTGFPDGTVMVELAAHQAALDEIAAKDEEIARLERELAARPSLPAATTSLMGTVARGESFGAPHPAPKTRKAR